MSNESYLDDGKSSTNEKDQLVASSSQPNQPAFPPPPPPQHPSSSSSSNPPSHPEVSVAVQLAQLFSLATQQASENKAFKAEIARLSSENEAHVASLVELRKKVGTLEKTVEDQGMVIAEVSRTAVSGGHWLWEGGKEQLERSRGGGGVVDGRWLWSLEHYKPQPPRSRTGPPPSLDSLSVELIDIIFSLLDLPELVALCRVSLKVLQRASNQIYGSSISLRSKHTVLFFTSRLTDTPSSYDRIRWLLLPKHIHLSSINFNAAHLDPLSQIQTHHDPIPIDILAVLSVPSSPPLAAEWSPVFSFLNPKTLQFGSRRQSPDHRPATFDWPLGVNVSFLDIWTRIELFLAYGSGSVPIVGGDFAFFERLRELASGRRLETRLAPSSSMGGLNLPRRSPIATSPPLSAEWFHRTQREVGLPSVRS